MRAEIAMPNFVSFMECVNHHGPFCIVHPTAWPLWLVLAAAVLYGRRLATRSPPGASTLVRRTAIAGASLVAASIAIIAGFFVLDPDPILGVEDNPLVNGIWIAAITAFGLGGLALFASAGLWLGRRQS